MDPVLRFTILPQMGHWTHDELLDEDVFVGSVRFLMRPFAPESPLQFFPLVLPVVMTIPRVPGYTWTGPDPPSPASSADIAMTDPAEVQTDSSSETGEIPLSAYPPFDPVTGIGFLLPGVPVDYSGLEREVTPTVEGATATSPTAVLDVDTVEDSSEVDPSEGTS